jgi:hypothetical protein
MQSDNEDFDEAVESHTPERKTQDPEGRFSLRLTPSRVASEKLRQKKMEDQNLLEGLLRRSAATSSAGEFAFWGASSFNYENAGAKTILKKDYTPKEKADRLQEMQHEQANVEKEYPNELFDICGANDVEEIQMIDIPFGKGKTQEEEEHIANCIQVNELKKKRAAIYASITRGEKTLMRLVQKADPGDWEIFQSKMKGSFETLTQIMDNLQMIGFDRAKGEDE